MKRGNQFVNVARAAGREGQAMPAAIDGDISDDRDARRDGDSALRQTVRRRSRRARSTRAHPDLYKAAPTDPKGCGARSDAASYVRSSRWRTRRSTSWSAAGIPAAVLSHGALRVWTWPK